MAKMYPPVPEQGTPASERAVFRRLQQDLPDDWKVLHARRIVTAANAQQPAGEGEADFVVIAPGRGLLVLEVKGGKQIGRDRDGWYSISHQGERFRIKDPGQQAQTSAHRFYKCLQGKPGWPDDRRIGWAVVFPDVEIGLSPDPALPREKVLDRNDLQERLRSNIQRAMDASGVAKSDAPTGMAAIALHYLNPEFRFVRTLSTTIGEQEQQLLQLTHNQFELVEAAMEDKRLAIQGCAGSGKTLIGMEVGRRLAEEGQRVLMLCYNSPLSNHLSRQAQGFTVRTFHKLCTDMLRGTGQKPPQDADETWFRETSAEVLDRALDMLPDERWDAVLVDEGQDFAEMWWLPIEKMLKDPTDSRLYVFWDPDQDIYGGGPGDALELRPLRLKYNCRNTKAIGNFSAARVNREVQFRPEAPEGDAVTTSVVASDKGMLDAVRKTLHELTQINKVPTEQIVILTPRSLQNSDVFRAKSLGNLELIDAESVAPGPRQVRCSSIHRYKGLESDVVVVCELTEDLLEQEPKLCYVGASRAKHALYEIVKSR